MVITTRRSRTLRVQLLTGLAPFALAAMLVAGCGSSGASQILSTVGAPIGNPDDAAAPSAAASAAPAEAPGGTGGNVVGDSGAAVPDALRDRLKIVYTGSLQLVVADLPAALAKAKAAVLATGGYVGASQESNSGDASVATITYRIPAERWDDAIGSLRGLASEVVAESTEATEVGGQIVDLEARLRNLRASEASLQAIA